MKLLVDTDVGLGTPNAEIDDGAALVVLRNSSLQVHAVTTVGGNVPIEPATHNTRRLLSYLDWEELPIGRGAARPLVQDPAWFDAWQSGYGQTPPWPAEPDLPIAAHLIVETVRAHPGDVKLLSLGPLTNLALAARLAPDIVGRVREVVAMGGSFGRGTPSAEFNVRCDPEAAHIVFTAGWPLRLLGLNVTRPVLFSRDDFARLPDHNPAVALLKQQAQGWIDRVEGQGWERGGCALHDAVAVAALLDESLFEWTEAAVAVELHHPDQRGVTSYNPSAPPSALVATAVDSGRCHALIDSLLSADS